jgi:hypothetical protein
MTALSLQMIRILISAPSRGEGAELRSACQAFFANFLARLLLMQKSCQPECAHEKTHPAAAGWVSVFWD